MDRVGYESHGRAEPNFNCEYSFYIYGNIRLKEISILNSFEQIQENTIVGSAFLAQLGRGFHTRPMDRHIKLQFLERLQISG